MFLRYPDFYYIIISISVLSITPDGQCSCVVGSHSMLDGSAVGMSLMKQSSTAGSILTLNWRSRTVTEWGTNDGSEIRYVDVINGTGIIMF